ncbi:MAG: hypothetical protein LC623_09005 [Halobacteriales archaeon]|nr:hypothetical protein [Halobacteriales archaeon]
MTAPCQRRDPVAFERVLLTEITAEERTVLGNYEGNEAEAKADECLRQVARGLQSTTCVRHVLVHVWTPETQFFFPHEVRSLDTDDSVRGKIVHLLDQMLRYPALRLVPSMTVERVRGLIDVVGGFPNVVRIADKLGELAVREMRTHELRVCWEDGMTEFYAELAALLRLGYPASAAVEKAKTDATQEVGATAAEPDAEQRQCLQGIEAAWQQSLSLLHALEATA